MCIEDIRRRERRFCCTSNWIRKIPLLRSATTDFQHEVESLESWLVLGLLPANWIPSETLVVSQASPSRESESSNSESNTDRLVGVLPVCEDWHAKLCLLQVYITYIIIVSTAQATSMFY